MRNCFVYDYRGEPAYNSFSDNLNEGRCKLHGMFGEKSVWKSYIEVAKKKTNTWLLIEEATIFLNGRQDEAMRELLVSKRHRGHNIILLFHTIRTVPPFIFDMCDYIFLHKTAEDAQDVKKKRPSILPQFLAVKQHPNKYHFVIIKNV